MIIKSHRLMRESMIEQVLSGRHRYWLDRELPKVGEAVRDKRGNGFWLRHYVLSGNGVICAICRPDGSSAISWHNPCFICLCDLRRHESAEERDELQEIIGQTTERRKTARL